MSFLVKLDKQWYYIPSLSIENDIRKICELNKFEIKNCDKTNYE